MRKTRRAILLPTGVSALATDEHIDLDRAESAIAVPFLLACDEVSLATVRNEWPFLARLATSAERGARQRLRPSLLFLAALLAAGNIPWPGHATIGAALELSSLGALAFLSPPPTTRARRGVDWALTATVLSGDFLLSQASRLIADSTPELSWSFADWLAEFAALRTVRLAAEPCGRTALDEGSTAASFFAALFEFPVRIGAQLGGAPPDSVDVMRDFGRHCGHAFLHAEDVLALSGRRSRLDTTLEVILRSRISAIPEYLGDHQVEPKLLIGDTEIKARALEAAMDECRRAARLALKLLPAVPDPTAAAILRRFVIAIAAPAESVQAD